VSGINQRRDLIGSQSIPREQAQKENQPYTMEKKLALNFDPKHN